MYIYDKKFYRRFFRAAVCVCVCVLFRLRDGEDVRMMWISCLIQNGKFVWQFNRRVPEM